VSALLEAAPFSGRDDALLLAEMNQLTRLHLDGCPAYRAMWPDFVAAEEFSELPFVHVGVFKHLRLQTSVEGMAHQRVLKSSSTSGVSSQIALDDRSGPLQARASMAVLESMLGSERRPLLVNDSVRALQQRGEVSARITAAMSLRPLSTEMLFLLRTADDASSMDWLIVENACNRNKSLLVYGFTWILWKAWIDGSIPEPVRHLLAQTQIHFVHSGGWKKLEAIKVDRDRFESGLLGLAAEGSKVLDFYGLVEQVGIVFPLCSAGFRHVPRWGSVIVRDPWTLAPRNAGEEGMLQLMNPLAFGAPYHSVLTEDMGRLAKGECPCGLKGQRFELTGRMPKAEVRGCANV
jgi:hypothetical protein